MSRTVVLLFALVFTVGSLAAEDKAEAANRLVQFVNLATLVVNWRDLA